MSTLEEVRKAYDDLSEEDKKSFHQSISDRVHESIAAQEEDKGEKDTQTAADREHEALGAEHADERREEAREEVQEAKEEKRAEEMHGTEVDHLKEILARLDGLDARLDRLDKAEERDVVEEKREKYGLTQTGTHTTDRKEYTDKDIDALLGR